MRTMFAFLLSLIGASIALGEDQRVTVVSSLQPLYSIGWTLAHNTNINVEAVPVNLPAMGSIARALTRADAEVQALLQKADAVIGISSLWPDDPLYRVARSLNIRVVEIDAGHSITSGKGVATLSMPADLLGERSPAGAQAIEAWFAPTNAIRMAEIIAADFTALSPVDEATIQQNLRGLTGDLRDLMTKAEQLMAPHFDATYVAMTTKFIYLFSDLGIYVDGYALKQDARWTPEDMSTFEAALRQIDASYVIHQWEPSAEVVEAIQRAGAELVVLSDIAGDPDAGSADPHRYLDILRSNLNLLSNAAN